MRLSVQKKRGTILRGKKGLRLLTVKQRNKTISTLEALETPETFSNRDRGENGFMGLGNFSQFTRPQETKQGVHESSCTSKDK